MDSVDTTKYLEENQPKSGSGSTILETQEVQLEVKKYSSHQDSV